jgi:flagellar motor switch protein FliG
VDAIAETVGRTLLAGRGGDAAMRPEQRLGAIFDYASGEFRDGILSFLEASDAEFAGRTRRSMFTFPDIETRLRRQDVSAVVRAVDQKVLVTALAGAERNAPGAKTFILSSISSRMAEAIEEEIRETGAVRGGDAEAAQSEVIRAIRVLERSGEITLVREDEA